MTWTKDIPKIFRCEHCNKVVYQEDAILCSECSNKLMNKTKFSYLIFSINILLGIALILICGYVTTKLNQIQNQYNTEIEKNECLRLFKSSTTAMYLPDACREFDEPVINSCSKDGFTIRYLNEEIYFKHHVD